jgi:hypothetical protein
MQEQPIGWDPMYEVRLPWESKLFLLYLLLVLAVSLVRSFSLVRQLWWFSASRRSLPKETQSEADRADILAASGLSNRFSYQPTATGSDVLPDKKDGANSYLRVLQEADNKFLYLSEMCAARIGSMKRLVPLTFLVSALLLVYGASEILTEIMTQKAAPIGFLTGRIAELLVPFALGILVCALLYAFSSLYEGALIRRRARWNYYCATAKGRLTD